MNRRFGRLIRICTWSPGRFTLTFLTVALLVLFIASARYCFRVGWSWGWLDIVNGQLGIQQSPYLNPRGSNDRSFSIQLLLLEDPGLKFGIASALYYPFGGLSKLIPLSPYLASLVLLTIVAHWLAWRFRDPPGLCRRCRYDLRGTPDRCPECGLMVALDKQPLRRSQKLQTLLRRSFVALSALSVGLFVASWRFPLSIHIDEASDRWLFADGRLFNMNAFDVVLHTARVSFEITSGDDDLLLLRPGAKSEISPRHMRRSIALGYWVVALLGISAFWVGLVALSRFRRRRAPLACGHSPEPNSR